MSGITIGSNYWDTAPCPGPWVQASVKTNSIWAQAQHLHSLHDSIWFIWFDTIIGLSNLSFELWNRKLKINEIYFQIYFMLMYIFVKPKMICYPIPGCEPWWCWTRWRLWPCSWWRTQWKCPTRLVSKWRCHANRSGQARHCSQPKAWESFRWGLAIPR